MIESFSSPNYDERPHGASVDMLVLHYTGMPSAQEALEALCDPAREVSAHYFIYENGKTLALVPEGRRAWHAGKAYWRGHRDINARSIGVELVNPGHEWGYRDFPAAQMDALIELAQGILERHPIPARNVLAHSDVAPARKQDPGDRFDWGRLASKGIGLWAGEGVEFWPLGSDLGAVNAFNRDLECFGYDPGVPPDVATTAFQRHYRPWRIDGNVDVESHRILRKLIAAARES
ncbi:MAG: N-acetylmuramoyl-L-alanine amidase [Hyphomicrobiales bacterium]|nr:N-acetylmuramoyl-L-alanine amidase [Hyphomicrobiales bacterium]MCY4052407.1 N-acetylmuramoyl-L-alanine amidase [Hyphomicrobiales bacterium]